MNSEGGLEIDGVDKGAWDVPFMEVQQGVNRKGHVTTRKITCMVFCAVNPLAVGFKLFLQDPLGAVWTLLSRSAIWRLRGVFDWFFVNTLLVIVVIGIENELGTLWALCTRSAVWWY